MAMEATFKAMYPPKKQNPGLKKVVAAAKAAFDELKHPRDSDGKFASKPGLPNAPKTPHLPKKKAAPKVKGHKPNYMPPVWAKIKGTNAKTDGHKLYQLKTSGKFKDDHEMYLYAAKLAAAYKKKHPGDSNVASANQIYNAALRHEIDEHGKHVMLPQLGVEHKAPDTESPKEPSYHHGKTPGGVKMSSKFLAPGQIKPTGKKMQGVSGAMVYEDSKGNQWLVKFPGGSKGTSKAYSNNKFLVDLDIATSRIQNKAGLPVPSIHGVEVDGKYASVHKMYSRVQEPFKNGQGVDLQDLTKAEILEIQKNMVLDWLISNHDAHSANFLQTDKGIIGIDKGQAFKYFGKDKLTPKFGSDLNPPLAPNKPVYSTLMGQYIDGKGELAPFDGPELAATIQRLQAIPDDEYKKLLRPYAEQAAAQGLLSYSGKSPDHDKDDQVTVFLAQAAKRKNNLAADFAGLQKQLDDVKAAKAPKAQPAAQGNTVLSPPKSKARKANQIFSGEGLKPGDKLQLKAPGYDSETVEVKSANKGAIIITPGPGQPQQQIYAPPEGSGGSWVNDFGSSFSVTKLPDANAPKQYKIPPENAISMFKNGDWDMIDLKDAVAQEGYDDKILNGWEAKGLITPDQHNQLKAVLKSNGLDAFFAQFDDPPNPNAGNPVTESNFSQLKIGDKVNYIIEIHDDGTPISKSATVKSKSTNVAVITFDDGSGNKTIVNNANSLVKYDVDSNKYDTLSWAGNGGTTSANHKPGEAITSFSQVKVGDDVDVYSDDDGSWIPAKVIKHAGPSFTVAFHDGTDVDIDVLKYDDLDIVKWHDDAVGPAVPAPTPPMPSSSSSTADWAKANDVLSSHPKMAAGYKIQPHPTIDGKVGIMKPTGEWSKSQSGEVKSWDSGLAALDSSTMAKYKTQSAASSNFAKTTSMNQAQNAADVDVDNLPHGITADEAVKFNNLKAKILTGNFEQDDYVQFKLIQAKITAGKKAAGAAQIVDIDESSFHSAVIQPPSGKSVDKKKLGGESWKKKGGQPPSFDKIKGPAVKELGQKLWERKQKGEFSDIWELYKAATSLSNAQKKAAQEANPGKTLQSSVDYSTANAIRNAALRIEFDATGNVIWETKSEKTSEVMAGQTVGEMKKIIKSHDHKPTVKASASQHTPQQLASFSAAFDSSAPVGSYMNPHGFKSGSTSAIRSYGYKYTDHISWEPGQRQAWYSFSGSYSGTINKYFRSGEAGDLGNVSAAKKMCKDLVAAFESPNVKPLDDWTIVVRGTSGGWELGIPSDTITFDEMKAMEGKVVRNKCPVSSSLRDRPPWGNYRITYKLPPGFKGLGLYGKSAHPGEDEMILPPGMAYRIIEVKKGSAGFNTEVLVEVVDVKLPKID